MEEDIKVYEPSHIRTPKGVKPPSEKKEQDELANEMLRFISDENVLTLDSFPISKSMAPKYFYKLANKNDYFDLCLDLARSILSDRLIYGWHHGRFQKDFVLRMLPLYNEEYKEMTMQKFKITEQARHQPAVINVVVPPIKAEEKST